MSRPWVIIGFLALVALVANLPPVWEGVHNLALVLVHDPRTIAEIQKHYVAAERRPSKTKPATKVRVLIVPGHEPEFGGAEFGALKERNLTAELGHDLAQLVAADSHYEVTVSRDEHEWLPELRQYFSDEWNNIIAWEQVSHAEAKSWAAAGGGASIPTVTHTKAPATVALRLYGLTKWANEHAIDITLHLHFNDYPGRRPDQTTGEGGKYSGFAIYVPAEQYGNSPAARAVAESIFKRLAEQYPVSDFGGESAGVIDDSELIAVGANNTADSASILIEYGYIYEPGLTDPALRPTMLKDLALQTFLGLNDFFTDASGPKKKVLPTAILPHEWPTAFDADHYTSTDVLALQTALHFAGTYPPPGKTKNDCPRSGRFGACTKAALGEFQTAHAITEAPSEVGPETLAALKQLF